MTTFTTNLLQFGNNVGVEVPDDVVASFGAGKRVPVEVTIAGCSYPSTIAVMGGHHLVPVAAAIGKAAGMAGDETHEVSLVHGTSARDIPIPDDLATALDAADVRRAFDALSPSRRTEHGRSVTGAKTEEARQSRIAEVIDGLN
jgi:hypothetical protein